MRARISAAVLAFALSAGAALAQAPAVPAVQPSHVRVLQVLDRATFDPARVLPPPPAADSKAHAAELAELRQLQRTRTPERLARAQWDQAHEDITIYNTTLGPRFDLEALPATRRALMTVRNDQSIIANIAKANFKRPRPWVEDSSLDGCERNLKKPLTSYPSGHATLGYSLAGVLESLIPEKSEAIRTRADDYAQSRLVCLVHYRSDVEASRKLGAWVAAQMLNSPAFKAQLEAARAELKAAGLTG